MTIHLQCVPANYLWFLENITPIVAGFGWALAILGWQQYWKLKKRVNKALETLGIE